MRISVRQNVFYHQRRGKWIIVNIVLQISVSVLSRGNDSREWQSEYRSNGLRDQYVQVMSKNRCLRMRQWIIPHQCTYSLPEWYQRECIQYLQKMWMQREECQHFRERYLVSVVSSLYCVLVSSPSKWECQMRACRIPPITHNLALSSSFPVGLNMHHPSEWINENHRESWRIKIIENDRMRPIPYGLPHCIINRIKCNHCNLRHHEPQVPPNTIKWPPWYQMGRRMCEASLASSRFSWYRECILAEWKNLEI